MNSNFSIKQLKDIKNLSNDNYEAIINVELIDANAIKFEPVIFDPNTNQFILSYTSNFLLKYQKEFQNFTNSLNSKLENLQIQFERIQILFKDFNITS